ncbi:hypothetical protein OSB04_019399 [Centaurea solstitialis]|uniref:Integrase catalytic domain-containing protein n=1 Tax=Centaurea solstitialis TaxID=347529 RepID=A0AA38T3P6_9ASTR|nr:hypothetical protein OSB04_019399 [Centaurea solstitialis]
MKRDVARYVEKCLTCLRVKAEHQRPHGKLQPLYIPVWKWEHITMDLITKLPRTIRNVDAIWVIVDRLTKSAHFIAINESSSSEKLADIYVKQIVARHGVPVTIFCDRDFRFTSRSWSKFHEDLRTKLQLSTAFHPQTDGQSERTIQTLEDMLRACVLDFGGSWDTYLPLAEFSYNNSYHASIGIPPYEMLYGRRCRTLVCWGEVGQRELGSTEIVQKTTESIELIRERLKTAQSRQKSYADKRRSDLEFSVGDDVLLKVSPWKGVVRFRKRGKLGHRFIGPFKVIARVGKVAYRLELPSELSQIHNTFHVSQLRKCLADEMAHIPIDDIQVDERLNYVERPIGVLERKKKTLRNKEIGLVKVQWEHRKGSEWTWEPEAEMRASYPNSFKLKRFRGRNIGKWGRVVMPHFPKLVLEIILWWSKHVIIVKLIKFGEKWFGLLQKVCNTFKMTNVSDDAVRLRLFLFSLKGRATTWEESIPSGTYRTWNAMVGAFLQKFFPPGRTAQLMAEITHFSQWPLETLYEAWERYMDMLKKCPRHGLNEWMIIQTFFGGLHPQYKKDITAAAGGALMDKTYGEAVALIENLAEHSYVTPRSNVGRVAKVQDSDELQEIKAQLAALTNQLKAV